MKSALIISACLLGDRCRYDGKSVPLPDGTLRTLKEKYILIPVCAECLGGLPTPRIPAERINGRVIRRDGIDVTAEYIKGACAVLCAAKEKGAACALLKERSPSCGRGKIYDGTFTGTLKEGNGVTADLLLKNGITVYGESETEKLI